MSWLRAIRKLNAAESQKAEDAVDAHIDPSVSLEMSIAEAQKNAETLKQNAAKVIADKEMAHMRLSKAQRTVDQATANAKAALANEQKAKDAGDDAGAQRAHAQAVMMAQQLAHAREAVATTQHLCEMADAAAATAQQRIDEEMEALNEALARKNEIQGKIDQAKMEKSMNDSMEALTSANQSLTPSLDQVEERAESMLAQAHATSGVQSEDPNIMALDVHHQAMVNSAEDILAELSAPADAPPAVTAG